jgi:integrase
MTIVNDKPAKRQRGSSIQRVVLQDGSIRWRFRLDLEPDATGKRRQRTVTRKTEAEAIAAQAKARADVRSQTYIEPSRITVSEWLDTWLEMNARTWRPATRVSYKAMLRLVRARIGERPLQELRREHVDQMVRDLAKSRSNRGKALSPRTVGYALRVLQTALKAAVIEDLLKRNPAEHVKPPVQTPQEMQTWTGEELSAFLAEVADDDLAGAWHLTALGLRRGEVLGLRWGDVDLENAVVHVRQARVAAYGDEDTDENGIATNAPKTKRGRRDVPLHPAAVAALRQTRQRTLLDSNVIPFADKRDPKRLVAVDRAGRPIMPDVYRSMFHRAIKAAGVPRIRLHDVRHTVGTLLLQRGIAPVVVAGILGHSPAVLLTTYAHALPDAKRDAVEVLGSISEAV